VFQELDTVVLAHDLDRHGLKEGDIGAVVHCYPGGAAYEVEFVTAGGETIALLTLGAEDIRPVGSEEILHIRKLARPA
jgi:hypothetical protein